MTSPLKEKKKVRELRNINFHLLFDIIMLISSPPTALAIVALKLKTYTFFSNEETAWASKFNSVASIVVPNR